MNSNIQNKWKELNILTPEDNIFNWGDFNVLIDQILDSNETLLDQEKKMLLKQHSENYPWLEILTSLKIWDFFIQIMLTWIKDMNDKYGQSFVDNIIYEFKKLIKEEIFKKINLDFDIIWNDYKNILLKLNLKNDDQNKIEKLKIDIYDTLKYSLDNLCGEKKDLSLSFELEIWEIQDFQNDKHTLEENIILSLAYLKADLEKKHLDLEYWYIDYIKHWYKEEFYTKLKTEHYHTQKSIYIINKNESTLEIVSKYDKRVIQIYKKEEENNHRKISDSLYELYINDEIPRETDLFKLITKTYYTKNILDLISEECIENSISYKVHWNNGTLEIQKVDKDYSETIGIYDENNSFFSPTIIRMLKKGRLPSSLILYKKLKKLLDLITIDWEFIFPESRKLTVETYKSIKENIISSKELKSAEDKLSTYYKWDYNLTSFHKNIYSKKWIICFLDIQNLWTSNYIEYYKLLQSVLNKEISLNEAKLQSWKENTKKIVALTNSKELDFIKYIWWDEIVFFILEENKNDIKNIVNNLHIKANGLWLEIRLVIWDYNKWEKCVSKTIELLDKWTKQSKVIENIFNKINQRISEEEGKLKEEWESIQELNHLSKSYYLELKTLIDKNTKQKEILQNFKKMFISIKNNIFLLHIWENNFILSDIVDEDNNLIPNSLFLQFLEKQWLWRKK